MLARMWGKGALRHCWWECKLVQPLWKTVWRLLKELKIELPSIPILGIYPKECKSGYNKNQLHTHVHYGIIHNSYAIETAKMGHN
jgi:hypothetical protein